MLVIFGPLRQKETKYHRVSDTDKHPTYPGYFGIPDGKQLLSDDRQHFNIDSVEFIEATPCP